MTTTTTTTTTTTSSTTPIALRCSNMFRQWMTHWTIKKAKHHSNSNNNNNNNPYSKSHHHHHHHINMTHHHKFSLIVLSILLMILFIGISFGVLVYRFYLVYPYQFNSDLSSPHLNYFDFIHHRQQVAELQQLQQQQQQRKKQYHVRTYRQYSSSSPSSSSLIIRQLPSLSSSQQDNNEEQSSIYSFGTFLTQSTPSQQQHVNNNNNNNINNHHNNNNNNINNNNNNNNNNNHNNHKNIQMIKDYTSTLEYKLNQLKTSNNEVIVTIATSSFKNLLFNWLCSLSAIHHQSTTIEPPLNHLLIYTIDPEFGNELIQKYHVNPIHVYIDDLSSTTTTTTTTTTTLNDEHTDTTNQNNNNNNNNNNNDNKDLKYDTRDYQLLMVHRTRFIRKILHMNHRVLLVDSDSIWFHSPLDFIHSRYSGMDLVAQNDEPSASLHIRTIICGGFLYLNNTRTMKRIWDIVTEKHAHQILNNISVETEQDLLNKYRGHLKVQYLPMESYPSGAVYFGAHGNIQNNFPNIHVVHNNWVIGKKNKMKRFYSFKGFLWLLDDEQWEQSQALQCTFRAKPQDQQQYLE